jgi:hypothetical protein
MTANQRRPGFRLPWSSEDEDASAVAAPDGVAPERGPTPDAPTTHAAPEAAEPAKAEGPGAAAAGPTAAAANASSPQDASPAAAPAEAIPTPPLPAADEASPDFMRDLVSAMRRVADEARQAGVSDVHATTDEQVKRLETEAEDRRNELRARADADVAGIGEWATAEAERIRKEAEQRVVARREQLELELGAETARAEAETKALRERVGEYERELGAYHAQLAEINDPAAFAAAAKRMPRPPAFEPRTRPSPAHVTPEASPVSDSATSDPATDSATTDSATTDSAAPGPAAPAPAAPAPAATAIAVPAPERATDTNGVTPSSEVHPAEEEVLAARLAELDAELPDAEAEPAAPAGEPTTTEIVVSGLGSFGAITGFRQALAGVSGIEGVALSLGQTGEFIFRATHRVAFDVGAAITSLEGEAAKIESRPDGSLHVTLDRPR